MFTGVVQGVLLWFWRGEKAFEKLHHHTLPLCVTPAARVVQGTVQPALSFITKVNIVLEAYQNALSWPRVPHFILCSQITFSPCCWLPSCSFGHLPSFSDTDTLSMDKQALGVLWEPTPTLSEVFGFAEAQNMPFLDSVG